MGIRAAEEVPFALGLILSPWPLKLLSSSDCPSHGSFQAKSRQLMNLSAVWSWSGRSVFSQCTNRQPLLHDASRRWVIYFLSTCGFVCVCMLNRRRTLEISAGRKKKSSEGVCVMLDRSEPRNRR